MKKITLFLSLFLLLAVFYSNAQSLSLTQHGNPVPNGAVLDVLGSVDTILIVDAKVHNNSASAVEVKVKKEEIYMVPGSMNTFCFAGNCYGGSTTVSVGSVNLPAGGNDTSFTGDYYPLNNTGISIIRYTFFNVANLNDTISITVRFNGTIGIEKAPGNVPELSAAYPNPATDQVTFNYSNTEDYGTIVLMIRDFAGRTIKEGVLPAGQGIVEFDLSSVESGVYFYSLIRNQQALLTRKLVVKK